MEKGNVMARYDSYILRTWRSTGAHGPQWSGRLAHVQGGEELCFSDPRSLLCHLQAMFAEKTATRPAANDDLAATTRSKERENSPIAAARKESLR